MPIGLHFIDTLYSAKEEKRKDWIVGDQYYTKFIQLPSVCSAVNMSPAQYFQWTVEIQHYEFQVFKSISSD